MDYEVKPIPISPYHLESNTGETFRIQTGFVCKRKGRMILSINGSNHYRDRLVLETFHRYPKYTERVVRKDGDLLNDRLDNLRWSNDTEFPTQPETEWKRLASPFILSNTGVCGRELNPYFHGGFNKVCLTVNYEQHHYPIHYLVFITFHRPLNSGEGIRHSDLNRMNNRADNLEACTPKQLVADYAKITGQYPHTKLNPEQIIEISKSYPKFTIKELAKKYDVTRTTIREIVFGILYPEVERTAPKPGERNLTRKQKAEIKKLLQTTDEETVATQFRISLNTLRRIVLREDEKKVVD